MITIYKKKSVPISKDLIELNDVYFNRYTAGVLDERAADIISRIDQSKMIDRYSIQSRFDGSVLNIDKLSTGCKTALNILYNPDKVFDIRECGDNAIDIIYAMDYGNVTCDYPLISFDVDEVKVYDKSGDKVLTGYDSIKEWWNQ